MASLTSRGIGGTEFPAFCEPLEDRRLLAAETLIATGSVWRYLDNGSDQGGAWVAPSFSDAAWKSGAAQLGYGDGDEVTRVSTGSSTSAKVITTYFRRAFTVDDPATISSLDLKLKRDDGAVIYLNGREVRRVNMPGGAVTYTTRASSAIGGSDENAFHPFSLDRSALVEGTNVIAVELHQSGPDSTDISFDLALLAERVSTSPPAPDGSFSIAVMPDTQFYAQSYPATFDAQTSWIASRAEPDNIKFVTHVGDIVQNGAQGADRNLLEWTRADGSMDKLDGVVPYSATLGNHDYDVIDSHASATRYVEFFGPSRYAGRSWYGGASPDGRNHYQLFSAGGYQFLHLNLEWEAPDSALAWARSVMDANPDRPVMITTHSYLKPDGTRSTTASAGHNSGEDIWNELVRYNPWVFMVVNGHYTGERHRVVENQYGLGVIEMVVDYQGRSEGGQGFLRMLNFVPGENRIDATTYSPSKGIYETDANSQFSIPWNFADRFGPPSPTLSSMSTDLATAETAPAKTRRAARAPVRPRPLAMVAPARPFATGGTVCGPSSLLDDDDALLVA